MFGTKQRCIAELRALASSRGERLTEAAQHVELIAGQRQRIIARHDDLLTIIATHITAGGSPEHLRSAVIRAGFRAELEYALLDIAPNEKPAAHTTQEVHTA